MKLLSASEIREADAFTIREEPIASVDLMERAALRCLEWMESTFDRSRPIILFCGPGNNGGDGLALARLLQHSGYLTHAYVLAEFDRMSPDCAQNRKLMEHSFGNHLHSIHSIEDFPSLPPQAILVDALYGTGLSRPLEGLAAQLVACINQSSLPVVSIDVPSGLFCDASSLGNPVVKATVTLSFQCPKLAFLMAENEPYLGEVRILPIGLHPGYLNAVNASNELLEHTEIQAIRRSRSLFSHKGSFGHALLVAGSYGKTGAAILAAKSCLRSGAGLVSVYLPRAGVLPMQSAFPEAICIADRQEEWSECFGALPLKAYSSIGIGPGIGQHPGTSTALMALLHATSSPLVLDADALNLLAADPRMLSSLPSNSLLTPHLKEFERLFGSSPNQFERLKLQREKSRTHEILIILKGHYTSITCPDGRCFFNPTGNSGMATAGTGDVLTGLLTGLLAQGYSSLDAARLGVYLHGLAGDLAARECSPEAMIASDLIRNLGAAFKSLE